MKKLLFSVATSAIFAASLASTALANGNQNLQDYKPDVVEVPERYHEDGRIEIHAPVNPLQSEQITPYEPNQRVPEDLGGLEIELPDSLHSWDSGTGTGYGNESGRIQPELFETPYVEGQAPKDPD